MSYLWRLTYLILLFTGLLPGAVMAVNIPEGGHTVVLAGDTLPAPQMKCVHVADSHQIDLNWLAVPDPAASFYAYVIYHSSSAAGPFNVVDTVWDRAVNGYSHQNATVNPGDFYIISTISEIQTQTYYEVQGDTMRSILLNVVSPGINSGLAQLNWNSLFYNHPGAAAAKYMIFKKIDTGSWQLIDSTTQLFYQDTIKTCHGDMLYKIHYQDTSLCLSSSNLDGGTFEDKTPPLTPEIDSVSVAADGIHIDWGKVSTSDTWGYIIYQKVNALWTPLDTVYGQGNTHFLDSLSDGCATVNQYNVLSFDSCWNTSPSGQDHQNIVLQADHRLCQNEVELSWNPYINMRDSLQGYQIYRSIQGGAFTHIATNPPGQTVFSDTNLADSSHYCYFIRAVNHDKSRSSSTCKVCFKHQMPDPPHFGYLSAASVDRNSQILNIRGIVDTSRTIGGIYLYRSLQPNTGYQLIDQIPYQNTASLTYEDPTADVDADVYYYQLALTDSCGNEAVISNVVHNILLEGESIEFMKNRLSWNAYEAWLGLPTTYTLKRRIHPEAIYKEVVANVFYGGGTVDDEVSSSFASIGDYSYYVKASENTGNSYGIRDSSLSNTVLIRQESRIYIPNAFTPDGRNPVFKPVNVYLDIQNYRFRILNRYGQEIFLSKDPQKGWDGRYNGSPAPSGTYVYFMEFQLKNGQLLQKRGTVMLIR